MAVQLVWTADNEGTVYADGTKVDDSTNWREIKTVELQDVPDVIKVKAKNNPPELGPSPAFVALYVVKDGQIVMKTDSNWIYDGNKSVYVADPDNPKIPHFWGDIASHFLSNGVDLIWTSEDGMWNEADVGEVITFVSAPEGPAWKGATIGAGIGTAIGYGTTRDWKTVFGTGAGALAGYLIEKFAIRQ